MIAAIAVIGGSVVLGLPLARLLDRSASRTLLLASAYLLGIASAAGSLALLSLARIPWSIGTMIVPPAILAALSWIKLRGSVALPSDPALRIALPARGRALAGAIDAITVLALAGYALMATIAPSPEWDFSGIWGVKGRMFFVARGIDWHFLHDPFAHYTHPDYPILVPLVFDVFAIVRGSWDDQYLGILYVAFAAATLLIVRDSLTVETGSPVLSSLVTLGFTGAVCSPYIGIGEGPLIAYGTGAFLLIRRALRSGGPGSFRTGAVMLGLAAVTKNEGLAWMIAIALGLLMQRRGGFRLVARLWPAAAIALCWLAARWVHSFPTDLASEGALMRGWHNLRQLDVFLNALLATPVGKPLFWLGVVVAFALTARHALGSESFALGALAAQYAFVVAAYLATPYDIVWHIRFSAERVMTPLIPSLAYVAVVLLVQLLSRGLEPGALTTEPAERWPR